MYGKKLGKEAPFIIIPPSKQKKNKKQAEKQVEKPAEKPVDKPEPVPPASKRKNASTAKAAIPKNESPDLEILEDPKGKKPDPPRLGVPGKPKLL